MKNLICTLLLALPSTQVFAASDYNLIFAISPGLGVTNDFELSVDLNMGTQYITVNGAFRSSTGSSPATGTCFFSASGGIFCNVQADQNSYNLNLNSELSGTINEKGPLGGITDSATIRLSGGL